MKSYLQLHNKFFREDTAKPALPGRGCRPLEGEAAKGRFGGKL
jgi:hypothetical protein